VVADSDDTGMNMVLGALLHKIDSQFGNKMDVSNMLRFWTESHSHFEDMFELAVKYSYCPHSEDLNKNVIDSRTYYWLREFI